ncbi:MAG: (2Fe-2S)-binding protein [Chloroflexi bacterium]|nr:MAG: (2Fe-2S)-binding protein [Chloroflexota bacterium]
MPLTRTPGRAVLRGPGPAEISFSVNGDAVTVTAAPRRTLLDTLRETLGLTGTKKVCDEGTCGACTVLVDGRPVYSCMTLAITCEGKRVETIEGLAKDGELHPVQRAFIDADAFQCGFCTPGQIMSIVALLRENAAPTEDDVRRAVAGNLCRCGAYPNIVSAGVNAAKRKR